MTVTQKAVLFGLVVLAVIAIAIALTAYLSSLRTALIVWLTPVVAVIAYAFLQPVPVQGLDTRSRPELGYQAALARFSTESPGTDIPLNALCHDRLLTHGQKTEIVVVLIHGISSCPQAFVALAPLLHERGHTVLAMRMPENGFADQATDALKDLTAEELRAYGDTMIDIAAGLGDDVIVAGISAGGTVAGWIGQNRPEVKRTVLIAPFFGLAGFGPRVNMALMRLMLVIPPVSLWKDPFLKEKYEPMPHAYKRQSTRGTGEVMRLGLATYRQAEQTAPQAGSAILVTNDNDAAIDNRTAGVFIDAWERQDMSVGTYEFHKSLGLGHEIIDPMEPGANPYVSYPVLINLIETGHSSE